MCTSENRKFPRLITLNNYCPENVHCFQCEMYISYDAR